MAPWSSREECRKDHAYCTQLADFYGDNEVLRARIATLEAQVEQAREALAGLQADGLTRLGVAEGAKPSNMRMGQVREIRWWLERVRTLREGGEGQ
jgi:hypothetical protein